MNPLVLDLPVRPPEAALIAEVVYELAGGKRITPEIRQRIASRASALKHPSIAPCFGSLQADPIHPSAFFLAVDGAAMDGDPRPLLLRFAPAASPASALFKDSLLIGRMRLADRTEVVVNAIPFGPSDHAAIGTFVSEVDKTFLPRPQGTATAILASTESAERAFIEFRQIQKLRGLNYAAFQGAAEPAIWAAIRAGWRDGYAVFAPTVRLDAGSLTAVEELIPQSIEATGFVIDPSPVPAPDRAARTAAALDLIARGRSGHARLKHFDFVLSLEAAPCTLTELKDLLLALQSAGRAPQSIAPLAGPDAEASIQEIRQAGAVVFLQSSAPQVLIRAAVKAPVGRVHCVAAKRESMLAVSDRLRA